MSAAKAKIDAKGIDSLCVDIINRKSISEIAMAIGVSAGSLLAWIEADADRSARVREARRVTAMLWDEKAETVIESASDEFELRKAKELAHHYRWRSAKIAPRDYGDKIQQEVSGPDGGPIETRDLSKLSDEDLEARLAKLRDGG